MEEGVGGGQEKNRGWKERKMRILKSRRKRWKEILLIYLLPHYAMHAGVSFLSFLFSFL